VGNQVFMLVIVLVAIIVFFTVQQTSFLSNSGISDLLNDWALVVLLAIGETFVIITAGIDLSVGAAAGFSSVVAAEAMVSMNGHEPEGLILLVGLVICIAIGLIVGAVNALLVNYAHLVPFVATLVTLGACTGLALVVSGGGPVDADSKAIAFNGPKLWVFSWPNLIVIALVVICFLYLRYSRFGRYTYAVGANPFATRAAGISVKRHIFKIYVLSGLLAGLTGMLYFLRLGSGSPTSGSGTAELMAIAAVVIGGVSLLGGVGKMGGVIIGAMILTVVTDGLVIININPNWNQVAVAGLIAAAAAAQAFRAAAARQGSE
jgi:ribose transport system permease protein